MTIMLQFDAASREGISSKASACRIIDQSVPVMSIPEPAIGPYAVIRTIGGGATGTVFLARHVGLDRLVALKVLKPECVGNAIDRERFRREAQAAMRLAHPSLVKIFDYGEDGPEHFFAMEYVEGRTLWSIIKEKGALGPTRSLTYARHLLQGLTACHEANLLHRDIKPANLLIDATDHLRILDLGFAKLLDRTLLTANGVTIGTPRYLAPELILGMDADARADIYQVGLIVYECLTGSPAFDHTRIDGLIRLILTADPPPIRRDLETPLLHQFLARTLAKDREERFANCKDALAFLAGGPARPTRRIRPSPPGRPTTLSTAPASAAAPDASTIGRARTRLAGLLGLAIILLAAALVLRPYSSQRPRSIVTSAYRSGPAGSNASHVAPAIMEPQDLTAQVGAVEVTLHWATAEPVAGVLSETSTGLTTHEIGPTRSHALTLSGLDPGRAVAIQVGTAERPQLARWVGKTLTLQEAILALNPWLEWLRATDLRAYKEFRRPRSPDERHALGIRFREDVRAALDHPEFRRARALCLEIAPLVYATTSCTPIEREWFLTQMEQQEEMRRFILEASGVDSQMPSVAGLVPFVLSREPEGLRPFRALTFAQGADGLVRLGNALVTQRVKMETVPGPALFGSESGDYWVPPSRYELFIPGPFMPAGRWKAAYVHFRVRGGTSTEKIVLRMCPSTGGRDGPAIAFLWPGPGGVASEGWVRVDERLLGDPSRRLRIHHSHRSARVFSEGVTLDHLIFYAQR